MNSERLTATQHEIIALLARTNLGVKDIATRIGRDPRTVRRNLAKLKERNIAKVITTLESGEKIWSLGILGVLDA